MDPRADCHLVRPSTWGGYPADYLVARVKARHAALLADWRLQSRRGGISGLSDEQIWGALLGELAWLHRQMNAELLGATAPLLGLFEIKTIVLALRNVGIQRTAVVRALVEQSLLDRQVQAVLLHAPDVPAAVRRLGRLPPPAGLLFTGLSDVYQQGKLRAVEDGLMRSYLEAVTRSRLHPALQEFFVRFVDLRNLVLVYKHLRWLPDGECRLIRGGRIELRTLERILVRRDSARFDALVQRVTRRPLPAQAGGDAAVETRLLRIISTRLATLRRDQRAVGVMVSYMWRLYVHARNLALLAHGKDVDPEALGRELIA